MKPCCFTLLLFASLAPTLAAEPRWDRVGRYETRQLEGWTSRVREDLLAQPPLTADKLRLLEFQIYQITHGGLSQHEPEVFALPGKLWEMPGSKLK